MLCRPPWHCQHRWDSLPSNSSSSSSSTSWLLLQLQSAWLTLIFYVVQFKAVKPVGDRVLVKVDKEEQKSVGGVLLPTAAQARPTAGSVVSAGDVSMVKVGHSDTVFDRKQPCKFDNIS